MDLWNKIIGDDYITTFTALNNALAYISAPFEGDGLVDFGILMLAGG